MSRTGIHTRSSLRLAAPALTALALFGAACGEGSRHLGPTVPLASPPAAAPPATIPTPPPGPPAAVLAVAQFASGSLYDVRLVLVETGGQSGAYFDTPILVTARGDRELGCEGIHRIERGGTWNMDTLSYCAPLGDGSREGLVVIVNFRDDEGRAGTLTSTMVAMP